MGKENKALTILESVSKAAAYQTLLDAIGDSLSAAVADGNLITKRQAKLLTPILNRILRHPKLSEADKIRILECKSLVESEADARTVQTALAMSNEIAIAKSLEEGRSQDKSEVASLEPEAASIS